LDYHQTNNFGGVSLTPSPPPPPSAASTKEDSESGDRADDAPVASQTLGERVQIVTLDSFGVRFCRLLKIDVEGMELQVLQQFLVG
jgi:FkbM family methyltransferase